jgi:hypothetical protein
VLLNEGIAHLGIAALRDFDPTNVRFGSKAAEMIGTMRWPMSALLPKADITASLSENPL